MYYLYDLSVFVAERTLPTIYSKYNHIWPGTDHPSLTVKNLLPNWDELPILVRSGDHSWSFWQIPVNSNSVLLIHGISAGQHKGFEMFKPFVFPMQILFILGYTH